MTTLDRFNAKWMPEPNTGCWLWIASVYRFGYGQIWDVAIGRATTAHRVSWELHCGPVPAGMFVCHRCDTPACVNPDHLFLGTAAENNADRDAKGRARGNEHRRGQRPYNPRNCRLSPSAAAEVILLHFLGMSLRRIARRMGVHRNTIWYIAKRHAEKMGRGSTKRH